MWHKTNSLFLSSFSLLLSSIWRNECDNTTSFWCELAVLFSKSCNRMIISQDKTTVRTAIPIYHSDVGHVRQYGKDWQLTLILDQTTVMTGAGWMAAAMTAACLTSGGALSHQETLSVPGCMYVIGTLDCGGTSAVTHSLATSVSDQQQVNS